MPEAWILARNSRGTQMIAEAGNDAEAAQAWAEQQVRTYLVTGLQLGLGL